MNYSGPKWNYEVLGGTYDTKSDAAVTVDKEIWITGQISISVTEIENHELTFRITGISGEHVHTEEKPHVQQKQFALYVIRNMVNTIRKIIRIPNYVV